jgi:hypothetical protein
MAEYKHLGTYLIDKLLIALSLGGSACVEGGGLMGNVRKEKFSKKSLDSKIIAMQLATLSNIGIQYRGNLREEGRTNHGRKRFNV